MRTSILILFFLFFSFSIQAQFEISKRKVVISVKPDKLQKKKIYIPTNNPTAVSPVIKFESNYFKAPKSKFLDGLAELPKVGEIKNKKEYELRQPYEDYTQKFNEQLKEDGIRPELYNRDMNLGQFVVYTPQINLNSRDYGAIDGDLVRVWVNGVVVTNKIYLESQFKELLLNLEKGINVIEIEALNYGELSPNTGQFAFYDSNKEFITNQYWNLGIGYKARIVIEYKEKILKKIDEK
jgi:hypothetical protein